MNQAAGGTGAVMRQLAPSVRLYKTTVPVGSGKRPFFQTLMTVAVIGNCSKDMLAASLNNKPEYSYIALVFNKTT